MLRLVGVFGNVLLPYVLSCCNLRTMYLVFSDYNAWLVAFLVYPLFRQHLALALAAERRRDPFTFVLMHTSWFIKGDFFCNLNIK